MVTITVEKIQHKIRKNSKYINTYKHPIVHYDLFNIKIIFYLYLFHYNLMLIIKTIKITGESD